MCFSPIKLKESGHSVPCGSCAACLKRKRDDWAIRLEVELKHSQSGLFVTMTYDDENIPIIGGLQNLCKRDVQLFMKRLRKKSISKLRYYLVGEYGEKTQRPHYHMLLFNFPKIGMQAIKALEEAWQKGHVHIGTLTEASIAYTAKYIINKHGKYDKREKPFALMSRRPPIGSQYLKTHKNYHATDSEKFFYTSSGGIKRNLPRYYRDRVYSPHQRKMHAARSRDRNMENEKETLQSRADFKTKIEQQKDYIRRMSNKKNNKL